MVVGTGLVSADGSVIETISGGVRAADWHFTLPPSPGVDGSSNNNNNQDPCRSSRVNTGSQTDVASGNLTVDHTLATYRSLGQSIALRLVYNSLCADPQPVIISDTTILLEGAVPLALSSSLNIAGVDQGVEVFTDTSGLNESVDETIRQVVQFDAGELDTGLYPCRLAQTGNYAESSVSNVLTGDMLVNNQRNSPFGAGWTLDGLQRLHLQPDGKALLTEGYGSAKVYGVPPPVPPQNGLVMQLADAPDTVTPLEFTVTTASGTSTVTSFVVPVVNFPDTGFSEVAFFNVGSNGVIDSGSTALAPVGDDISIQPPGGNETFGASFKGFLFLPQGGDVTFTVGVDDFFELFINGKSVMKYIGLTDFGFRNVPVTVRNLPSGFVPITLNFAQYLEKAVIILSATGGGLPGGVIAQEFLFTAIPAVDNIPRSFIAPPGEFSTLVRNEDGTFTRTLKEGTPINFDARGLHTSTVDRNGNKTHYTYDAVDRLISITDPVGLVTTLTYSGGLLSSITDPAGRTTAFAHDTNGNLTRITDPDGTSMQCAYDARHRMTSHTSKTGLVTTYDYNFAGRNMGANRPDGSQRQLSPSQTVGLVDISKGLGTQSNPAPVVRPEGVSAPFTDGKRNVTLFKTDRFGASTEITDALGKQTVITRDDNGDPVRIVNPDGAATALTYDKKGNLLTSTEESIGATGRLEYEPTFNQPTKITDAEGRITEITYDAKGNPTKIKNALNEETRFTYNPQGQVTSITDALGHTTTFDYNAQGLLMRVTDPLGRTTIRTYDAAGNVLSATDALGRTTFFTYDRMNQVLTTTDANGGVTRYTYDTNGNLLTLTNAKNQVTRYTYDPLDRVLTVTNPVGDTESYTYDANGNLESLTTRNGATIRYEVTTHLVPLAICVIRDT